MPNTAKFKEELRGYASRAKPSRANPTGPKALGSASPATEPSAAPHQPEAQQDSREAVRAERSLHNLPDRGAVLDPEAAARTIFPGVTERELPGKMKWVRENVPLKLILGHKTVGWFEADVRWWLEDRRNGIVESASTLRTQAPARGRSPSRQVARTRRGAAGRRARVRVGSLLRSDRLMVLNGRAEVRSRGGAERITPRRPHALCSATIGLEQLDGIAVRVFDLNLFATGPLLHRVAETSAACRELGDAR